jgi:hypothetical protein
MTKGCIVRSSYATTFDVTPACGRRRFFALNTCCSSTTAFRSTPLGAFDQAPAVRAQRDVLRAKRSGDRDRRALAGGWTQPSLTARRQRRTYLSASAPPGQKRLRFSRGVMASLRLTRDARRPQGRGRAAGMHAGDRRTSPARPATARPPAPPCAVPRVLPSTAGAVPAMAMVWRSSSARRRPQRFRRPRPTGYAPGPQAGAT